MAFRVSNIEPIDLQPRVAIGISLPFNGSTGFNSTYTTADQLKTNILSFLLTNRGERVFNPNFGADLRNLLFENVLDTTTEDLRERIQNDISLYFPEVQVRQIIFNNIPDTNTINFTLIYEIVLFGIEESVNILLQ